MKKIISIMFMLFISISIYTSDAFISYYNNNSNWEPSKKVGEGTLIVNQKFTLDRDLILPSNIEVKIVQGGEISTTYRLALTGDPNNPPENDPKVIFSEKIKAVMTIINTLLLD